MKMPRKPTSAAASGLSKKRSPSIARPGSERPHDLGSFVCAVLEPQPAESLIDIHFNLIARQARREAWRKASWTTECLLKWRNFLTAADAYRGTENHDGLRIGNHFVPASIINPKELPSLVKLWREAVVAQILTPAPTLSDLAWKRAASRYRLLPIQKAQVNAAIAADEAFFIGHPVKRPRTKVSG
jgi:hypothetical protein